MSSPRFDKAEYESRVQALQARMADEGMGAVLVMTGANIVYFCGYPAPALSSARPLFLIVPASGDPIFLVHTGRQFEAREYTRLGEVHTYSTLTRLPDELPDFLNQSKGERSRVGCELGQEMYLNLPVTHFLELLEEMGSECLVDATKLIWELRMVKSPAEVACHSDACRITGEAYEATFGALERGWSQQEIVRRIKVELIERGGSEPWVLINSGPGTYDFSTGMPSEKAIDTGDIVWMDVGCTVGGYWSDFSRAAVVGAPSEEQRSLHADIVGITQACVEQVRPGAACADLAQFCYSELAGLEIQTTSVICELAGRVGHGVGLATTEPPHISEEDDRALEQGMVVTIEPGVATAYGTFHFEANVVVTETGCDVMSTFPPSLYEI